MRKVDPTGLPLTHLDAEGLQGGTQQPLEAILLGGHAVALQVHEEGHRVRVAEGCGG